MGWGERSTAEREVLGEENRDQGVIPEEFLCEQGRLQKYLSAQLGLAFGLLRVREKENPEDTEKEPKEHFNDTRKELTIY